MYVFLTVVGIAALIAAMAFLYLKVVPKKHDGTFNKKIFQHLHDYFNFKSLYIESVMKFLFTLLTVACIIFGVVTILSAFLGIFSNIYYMLKYSFFSFGSLISSFFRTLIGGVAVTALGPVVIRLVYEGIMMFILLVKNTIDINNKLGGSDKEQDKEEIE